MRPRADQAAFQTQQDTGAQSQLQPATEVHLQGRSDRRDQSPHRAAVRRLRAAHRAGDQAAAREAHAGASNRLDDARDVEEAGGVRPRTSSTTKLNARLSEAREHRPPLITARCIRSQVEHGSRGSIHCVSGPGPRAQVPTGRLCPLGVPNEAMAHRGPDRRMVPALERRAHALR